MTDVTTAKIVRGKYVTQNVGGVTVHNFVPENKVTATPRIPQIMPIPIQKSVATPVKGSNLRMIGRPHSRIVGFIRPLLKTVPL